MVRCMGLQHVHANYVFHIPDAEAYEQYDGALQQGDEEVEEGIVEEIDEDEEEEELDATQQAELMKLMQQAQMIRGLEPAQPSTRGAQSAAAGARAQEQWSGLTSMPVRDHL